MSEHSDAISERIETVSRSVAKQVSDDEVRANIAKALNHEIALIPADPFDSIVGCLRDVCDSIKEINGRIDTIEATLRGE